MDLIYANENLEDIGVLKTYSLDMEYGSSVNDFELAVSNDNELQEGYYIYFQELGAGGIIDKKRIETSTKTTYYEGRTFEGIMDGKIIKPTSGAAYYVANGDANAIIADLIALAGLDNIFTVDSKKSVTVTDYLFRYDKLYTGITRMLYAYGYKLMISCKNSTDKDSTIFSISAKPLTDFSQQEEWDSTQLTLKINQIRNQVNHMVCLGTGNLADRHVIHIFCDKNGNVQATTKVDNPIKDEDYILDESSRLLANTDEIAYLYDYPNIENIVNYELLSEQPEDWATQSLFYQKKNDAFEQLSMLSVPRYQKLSEQPDDWTDKYTDYYLVSSAAYQSIPEQSQYHYNVQTSQPADWSKNYGNYYYYVSDGTSYSYEKVKSISEEYQDLQTMQPSDWQTNYSSYYELVNGEYKKVDLEWYDEYYPAPRTEKVTYEYGVITGYDASGRRQYLNIYTSTPWYRREQIFDVARRKYVKSKYTNEYVFVFDAIDPVLNHLNLSDEEFFARSNEIYKEYGIITQRVYYYIQLTPDIGFWYDEVIYDADVMDSLIVTKSTLSRVPAWQPNKYYTKKTRQLAPNWKSDYYYTLTITHNPPPFTLGTFYKMYLELVPNPFVPNKYYKMHTDHYAKLLEAGIKKLGDLRKENSINVSIDGTQAYDIGDLVGVNEETTGINLTMRVGKKILKTDGRSSSIQYTLEEV